MTTSIAVVLAGAVAKGAFEAGAIRALADADVEILGVVGSSSGALNGTMLAAAVASRQLRAGADQLVALWRDNASWNDVFHASVREVLRREGVSDRTNILALLRQYVPVASLPDPAPINLRLLVAALNGVRGEIADHPATTYESVREFTTADFTTRDKLERVFDAATASSAFPLLFAPVDVDDIGPCVDGGAVNNTPIHWALEGPMGPLVDTVVVIATSVELRTRPTGELHGVELGGHLAEMLVGERLYRDLRDAEQVNAALRRLAGLVDAGALDRGAFERVVEAIGWTDRRPVRIVQIRPSADLPGSAFAGFFDAKLRAAYVDAGLARGREVLAAL